MSINASEAAIRSHGLSIEERGLLLLPRLVEEAPHDHLFLPGRPWADIPRRVLGLADERGDVRLGVVPELLAEQVDEGHDRDPVGLQGLRRRRAGRRFSATVSFEDGEEEATDVSRYTTPLRGCVPLLRERVEGTELPDPDAAIVRVGERPPKDLEVHRDGLLHVVHRERRNAEARAEVREPAVGGDEPPGAGDDPRLDGEVVLGPQQMLDRMDALVRRRPLLVVVDEEARRQEDDVDPLDETLERGPDERPVFVPWRAAPR
jgi:hypothetical protein